MTINSSKNGLDSSNQQLPSASTSTSSNTQAIFSGLIPPTENTIVDLTLSDSLSIVSPFDDERKTNTVIECVHYLYGWYVSNFSENRSDSTNPAVDEIHSSSTTVQINLSLDIWDRNKLKLSFVEVRVNKKVKPVNFLYNPMNGELVIDANE